MFPYQWVLFDADETLFHFDAKAGLVQLFKHYDVEFTDKDYQEYQQLNYALWQQYQQGEITAQQLQITRFQTWSSRLNIAASQLNADFLDAMADVCKPIAGVMATLEKLSQYAKIGIVTNGFTALQKKRLAKTQIAPFIDLLVISEQVGAAKPETKIFEYVYNAMNKPPLDKVLMVGDNLDTDILGGNNFGFDTCWFNPNSEPNNTAIKPSFAIVSFDQLLDHFVEL